MGDSVKVAVRVRPFNGREKQLKSKAIISMDGNATTITNPDDGKEKTFQYDKSYWSHDSFDERADGYLQPTSPKYADQQIVFDDLGRGVLDNAWEGFNCSLFAYGQTGSGKSYSMVGYGVNKGIVPITCDELFKGIDAKNEPGLECDVSFSMLEIYNEQVQDLLTADSPKGGMKVRHHPKKGFYVDNLRTVPVDSFADIEARMEEGTKRRTIAATNMNATSSRAHTIVSITFKQKKTNEQNVSMTKVSNLNLVDLAGSERAASTGAEGNRLKEGAAINQSLSTLGNVISALVEKQNGKKKIVIPFRNSKLTMLLKNALGGNSKTVMIAALSPASVNYEETLSTLRFADRVKSIKTQAIVNETPTEKLIRELREENQRLLDLLGGKAPSNVADGGNSSEQSMDLKRQLEQNSQEMEEMKKSWEQKLKEERMKHADTDAMASREKEKRKTTPHLLNMNQDPALHGVISYFLEKEEVVVGSGRGGKNADIVLRGAGMLPRQAIITCVNNKYFIKKGSANAKVMLNGSKLGDEEESLHHHSRVLLGPSHLYFVVIPSEAESRAAEGLVDKDPTYEDAQAEIALRSGVTTDLSQSPEQLLLKKEIEELTIKVSEANAISTELEKNKVFGIELVPRQNIHGKASVMVIVEDSTNGALWLWSANRFVNRKFVMLEMFNAKLDGDEDWNRDEDSDPFYEPLSSELMIGQSTLFLQPIAYDMDTDDDNVHILNYQGDIEGNLTLSLSPCSSTGARLDENADLIEDPVELLGQEKYYLLEIKSANNLKTKFNNVSVSYEWFDKTEEFRTPQTSGRIDFRISYEKILHVECVSEGFLDWLSMESMPLKVFGDQTNISDGNTKTSSNTAMSRLKTNFMTLSTNFSQVANDEELQKLRREIAFHKKRAERSSRKIAAVKKLVQDCNGQMLKVSDVQAALAAGNKKRFKAAVRAVIAANRAKKFNDSDSTNESSFCLIQ
eukprot:m.14277 g.14277  ORF g.14277 m.14277 type:complete len:965 (-) comp7711_c0_seq1:436-3330(-)